jgi:hypothetical protein
VFVKYLSEKKDHRIRKTVSKCLLSTHWSKFELCNVHIIFQDISITRVREQTHRNNDLKMSIIEWYLGCMHRFTIQACFSAWKTYIWCFSRPGVRFYCLFLVGRNTIRDLAEFAESLGRRRSIDLVSYDHWRVFSRPCHYQGRIQDSSHGGRWPGSSADMYTIVRRVTLQV